MTAVTPATKLIRLCPYCGLSSERRLEIVHNCGRPFVRCNSCGATGPRANIPEADDAVRRWNRLAGTIPTTSLRTYAGRHSTVLRVEGEGPGESTYVHAMGAEARRVTACLLVDDEPVPLATGEHPLAMAALCELACIVADQGRRSEKEIDGVRPAYDGTNTRGQQCTR